MKVTKEMLEDLTFTSCGAVPDSDPLFVRAKCGLHDLVGDWSARKLWLLIG